MDSPETSAIDSWENSAMELSENSSNSSHVMDNATYPTDASHRCQSGAYLHRLIADVYVLMPIATIGIITNVLALIILRSPKLKFNESTKIILQALVVVDTLFLLSIIPVRSLHSSSYCFNIPPNYTETWEVLFRWLFPTSFFLRLTIMWLTLMLTIERWIFVCRPLKASRMCTAKSTYKALAITIVCAAIVTIPRFFESPKYGIFNWNQGDLALTNYNAYNIIYRMILFPSFMYFVPIGMIVTFNILLVRALRKRKAQAMLTKSSLSDKYRGITIMVILVTSTCVACNLLAAVSQLIWTVEHIHYWEVMKDTLLHLFRISGVLVALNSAINCALYGLSSNHFRTVMCTILCCRKTSTVSNRQAESVPLTVMPNDQTTSL